MTPGAKLLQDIKKNKIRGGKNLTEDSINKLKCFAETYEKCDGIWSGFLPLSDLEREILKTYKLYW